MAKIRRQNKWQRPSPKWLSSHLLKLYPFFIRELRKWPGCASIRSFIHSSMWSAGLVVVLRIAAVPAAAAADAAICRSFWGDGVVAAEWVLYVRRVLRISSPLLLLLLRHLPHSQNFLGIASFGLFHFFPSCCNRTVVFFFFLLQDLFHRVMVLFFSVSFLLLCFCSFVSWDVFSLRFLPDSSPFVSKHHVFCCRVFSGDTKAGSRRRKRRIRENWSRVVTCCLLACRGVRFSVWWFSIRSFWSQSRSRVSNLMKLLGLSLLSSSSVAQNG